ncbi:MAG: hypothetical protein K8R90_10955 [Candidatus Cloacimonetes bacterium]|nr:hypothetical protein [Candidatus Cloacimonadota bacterium]
MRNLMILMIFTTLLLAGCNFDTTSSGGGNSAFLVGVSSLSLNGAPTRITRTGATLFVLSEPYDLVAIDVQDPYFPWAESSTFSEGIALDTNYNITCVIDANGLGLWQIDNDWDMEETAFVSISSATDVDIVGNYAYVSNANLGLQVFDITDPWFPPFEVGDNWGQLDCFRLEVAGSCVYMLHPYGMKILSSTPVTGPIEMGAFTITAPLDVAVRGQYAYIAHEYGLTVVDISDPYHPNSAASYASFDSYNAIAIAGNYAFVCAGSDGIKLFDISDPLSPVLLDTYSTPGAAWDVVTDGVYAYVCCDGSVETLRLDVW